MDAEREDHYNKNSLECRFLVLNFHYEIAFLTWGLGKLGPKDASARGGQE